MYSRVSNNNSFEKGSGVLQTSAVQRQVEEEEACTYI